MHVRTRRGVALLTATAALAGGSFTTIAAATAADERTPSTRLLGLPILGDLLGGILGQVAGATVATIQGLIGDLTPMQVGDLLQAANAAELTKLLEAAQNTGQLTGALGTLTPTETADLLAPLTTPPAAPLTTPLAGPLTTPLAGPRPATVTPAARPAAQFTAYRATVGKLKLNKKRTSMKFTLTCASSAPKGCLVKVSARVAGKSAMRSMTMALLRGKATPITVTFSKSTTRRLKTKGGTLKITASTAMSSLPSATRTLKVKRLKTVRKAAR